MTEREEELQKAVREKAGVIARILARKKDVEIRTSKNGISVAEISKNVVEK